MCVLYEGILSVFPLDSPSHIVGHAVRIRELARDLEQGNVAHAYLFSGPQHIGKMTIAQWFAKQLLCQGCPPQDCQHVGEQIDHLVHPDFLSLDVLWVEGVCEDWGIVGRSSNIPQKHRSKVPKAKTDTISIEDIRALQQRLYETKTAPYRCCIIRSVERMQEAAANALLKILEEPPEGMVFVLTTAALTTLPSTLVSRTRTLCFSRVPLRELQSLFNDLDQDDVQLFLRVAQGAPGIIQRLKRDPENIRRHRVLHTRACSFWQVSSLYQKLQLLETLTERTEEAEQYLFHLGLALREQTGVPHFWYSAFHCLSREFRTPVQRTLLVQNFALSVMGTCVA